MAGVSCRIMRPREMHMMGPNYLYTFVKKNSMKIILEGVFTYNSPCHVF